MDVLTNLDLKQNEIQNVRLQNLATAPQNPVEGQMYYDTTLKKAGTYNGASWAYGDSGGTMEQVQSDWNQTDSGQPDYIKNKPAIPSTAEDVGAIPTASRGAAGGDASLDEGGKVPAAQLPSYVDDVLEYDNKEAFPSPGESGKIYVDKETNKTYRWSGTQYVEISESLALGETSSTAYPGDKGKAAYDHAQSPHVKKEIQTFTGTSQTYTVDGYILNVMLVDSVNKEQVMADVTYSAMTESVNNTVTIDCATAPSNPLYVVILYL